MQEKVIKKCFNGKLQNRKKNNNNKKEKLNVARKNS